MISLGNRIGCIWRSALKSEFKYFPNGRRVCALRGDPSRVKAGGQQHMSKRRYGVSESPSNIPPTEAALLKTLVDKIQYIQYAPESHAEADKRHRRGICNDMFSMVRIFHEEGAIDISRAGILHFFVYLCSKHNIHGCL